MVVLQRAGGTLTGGHSWGRERRGEQGTTRPAICPSALVSPPPANSQTLAIGLAHGFLQCLAISLSVWSPPHFRDSGAHLGGTNLQVWEKPAVTLMQTQPGDMRECGLPSSALSCHCHPFGHLPYSPHSCLPRIFLYIASPLKLKYSYFKRKLPITHIHGKPVLPGRTTFIKRFRTMEAKGAFSLLNPRRIQNEFLLRDSLLLKPCVFLP